jgi:hypothetical protein
LSPQGVPSIGKIVQVTGAPAPLARTAVALADPKVKDEAIAARATRPPVVIGLSSTCPYGLAACWGGAHAGLKLLSGVAAVRPLADARASVAFVYLDHEGLPDVGSWPQQFARSANGSYVWRGVEVTVTGAVQQEGGAAWLAPTAVRPRVQLLPLVPADKVQIDQENGVPRPLPASEAEAYAGLLAAAKGGADGASSWSVTGPLKQTTDGFELEVRAFQPLVA